MGELEPRGLIPPVKDDRPVNIVEEIWHYLSPFSAHQIEIWGEVFPTVEHAYHWAKFVPGIAKEAVKGAKSPLECLYISRSFKNDTALHDPAFAKEAVMEELFRAKLAQHPHVAEILQLSGKRGLLKIYPHDYFWGTGADGSGENRMGKLWMKLRDELAH